MRSKKRHTFAPSSIRGTLFLLLLVVFLPIALVQFGIYYSWFQARRAQELQANLEMARAVAAAFDAYLRDIRRQEAAVGNALTSLPPASPPQTNRLLAAAVRRYPAIRDFCCLDRQGRVIGANDPRLIGHYVGDRPCLQAIAAGSDWQVSDLLSAGPDRESIFTVAQALRDPSGRLSGVVAARLSPQRLDAELSIKMSGQGAFAVIDRRGFLVYRHPPVALTPQQRDWGRVYPIIADALKGTEGAGTTRTTYGNQRLIVAAAPIRSIGWVAGASHPETEILAPILRGLFRNLAASFLVVGLAFVVAVLMARGITRPIERLRSYVAAIGQGRLQERVEPTGPTELTQLYAAFNRMAGELQLRQGEHDRLLEIERARARDAHLLEAILANVEVHLAYLARDLTFLLANQVTLDSFGLAREDLLGRPFSQVWPDPEIRAILERVLQTGETARFREMPYQFTRYREKGLTYWDWTVAPVKDEQGRLEGLVISAMDMTPQVRAREQMVSTERARAELAETMAVEISHRTKNNLALISAILQLQLGEQPSASAAGTALLEAISRLQTLSVVHEQLSETRREKVELSDALRRIGEINRQALAQVETEFTVEGAAIYLPTRTASAISLVANELITNAIKYGSPEPAGKLRINVRVAREAGRLSVSVWNSGNPVAPDFDIDTQHGIGLRLAREVAAHQLHGRLALHPQAGGTSSELTIDEAALDSP